MATTENKHSGRADNKINVYFFMSTSLLNGRGFERTTLAYARHMDLNKFNVTIVHGDTLFTKRLDENELSTLSPQIRIIQKGEKHGNLGRLNWRVRSILPLGKLIEIWLLAPIIFLIIRKNVLGELLNEIREGDIVYFVDPADNYLFSRTGASFIGSNQGFLENPDALYTRLIVKFVKTGILFNKIQNFHLFPINSFVANEWKNKNCIILPSGIESSLYSGEKRGKGNSVKFLFVGALEDWKGIILAIEAFILIGRDTDVEFHIAGGGILEDFVRTHSKDDDRIIFHGIISEQEKIELYHDCDIFIYPSLGETFGIVITEALASGLFVLLGKNVLGNFTDAFNMGFIDYCTYITNEIKEKMMNLIQNIEVIRNKRSSIHSYAIQQYDWGNITNSLMSFIEDTRRNQ